MANRMPEEFLLMAKDKGKGMLGGSTREEKARVWR